ncbi:glycosyltransferase [Kineococcus sp. TBRC 1896]|uniref:Glycosyltransferase n=1 Tax=Kineococcus mangrovi TaxID=1660183 RepID=A0ABV4HXS9_9ACTN
MPQVFAVGRGAYDNIGDAILRRQLLDWLREVGTLNVYVGASPDGYDADLGLQPQDVVHRSLRRWYAAALAEAVRGRAAYAFKPGEIQLTLVGLKEHLVVLPLLGVLRTRRGRAVRVGVGARSFAPLPRALMRPSIALSDLTLWRDNCTAAYLRGSSMPDLAFGEGSSDVELGRAGTLRDVLVVSLRGDGDRPYPSPETLEGIREFARRRGLTIWAVTQVTKDHDRARRLADALGGEFLGWETAVGHDVQERALRELYRRTEVVVSDRLHVVIAAFTEGAVPVAGLVEPAPKLERHLSTVGVDDVQLDLSSRDAEEVATRLAELSQRRAEFFDRLLEARTGLRAIRQQVQETVGAAGSPRRRPRSRTDRARVHHLGRAGEIAGGMTQVLNGYLAGRFDRVDVDLLVTRSDPGAVVSSAARAARAGLSLARLPRDSSVVAAHLSAGGSFLREGTLLRLADRLGLATVAHLHGSSFAAFARRRPKLVRSVLGAADHIVSLSQESSDVTRTLVPEARITLVPNAVAMGRGESKERLVVFGGAVGRRKGVDVLLEAWSGVDAAGWRLLVVGPVVDPDVVPGGDSSRAGSVEFLGAVPHAELLELLERSSVAVLPSRGEAMPVFVLEAMARANAVVATDVGGLAEVLGDGRGAVVPAGDVVALREALQRAVSDEEWRARTAAAAVDAARRNYSTETIHPELEKVWLDALERRSLREGS